MSYIGLCLALIVCPQCARLGLSLELCGSLGGDIFARFFFVYFGRGAGELRRLFCYLIRFQLYEVLLCGWVGRFVGM